MKLKKPVMRLLMSMLIAMFCLSMSSQARSQASKTKEPLFSLKPLALLYAALYQQDIDAKQVLYPADQNVHDYQLSIADLRKVQQHQQILWFGPNIEEPLTKLSMRLTDKIWLSVGNKEHIWLEPDALASILEALIGTEPADKQAALAKNKQQFLQRVDATLAKWKVKFAPIKEQPIIVGHSAFTPLLNTLGVQNILTYSVGHGHSHGTHHHGGTRKQLVIQKRIQQGEVHCAISEPDLSFASLAKRFNQLTVVQLEPMATSLALNSQGFEQFLESSITAIYNCLAKQS